VADIPDKKFSLKADSAYRKGQSIYYKGDEAKILAVKPVFTIKIKGKTQIVCGNILLNDVCLK